MVEEVKGDFMDDGKIGFGIRCNNTPENEAVHKGFKAFCKIECDNNYTQGLRKLMEYYEADFKYASLYSEIVQLKAKVNELGAKKEEKKEDKEEDTF